MARLLIKGEWYDAVSSAAYWESEFEALVARQGDALFPEYYLVPFKTPVESEYGTAKPDFALIERSYRRWWVVEAELAHHSLEGHVLPQVQKLAKGAYGPDHALYLRSQAPHLDEGALVSMMKGQQPRVFLLVNAPCPEWASKLARYDALLAVMEIFRSPRNDHVLRVNGDYPAPPADGLSVCRWDPSVPRLLVVESPAALGDAQQRFFQIEYEGSLSDWTRIDVKDKVWLHPVKGPPIPLAGKFILANERERFVLRQSK